MAYSGGAYTHQGLMLVWRHYDHFRAAQGAEQFGSKVVAVAAYHADLVAIAEAVRPPVAGDGIVDHEVVAVQGIALDHHIMAGRIVVVFPKKVRRRVLPG